MTDTNDKIRAVFLAALMVLSVFAMTIAFGGMATARHDDMGNHAEGTPVAAGGIVFQGEENIVFGSGIQGNTSLTHINTGESLINGSDLPQDQTTGLYTSTGDTDSEGLVVQTPRVTDVEVTIGASGGDVAGGSVSTTNANDLRVVVRFNYEDAEPAAITVEDADGLDITNQVLNTAVSPDSTIEQTQGNVSIDISDEDAGDYTIIIEGDDDLDFGQATQTTTVTLTTQTDLALDLSSTTVTQGADVTYTISGGVDSDLNVVLIPKSDLRSDSITDATSAFRNVGDTVEVGVANASMEWERGNSSLGSSVTFDDITYAYAIVETDGTTGVGSVESRVLDDTSVDIELHDEGDPSDATGTSADDDVSLTVEEGTVSLERPTGSWILGSEIDVTGTATSADDVSIYARDTGNWRLVEVDGSRQIAVDADDTFESEDVRLNTGNFEGNDILSFPGTYRIGIIDSADANTTGGSTPEADLTPAEFSRGISASYTLRVVESELTANFATVNGQVAPVTTGETDISGTAEGENRVAYVFIDRRGNINADTITVDDDGTYDQEDIVVSDVIVGTNDFTAGQVTGAVLALGRDGRVGDGSVNGSGGGFPALTSYLQSLQGQSLSGQQVLSSLRSETVDDTASDDLIVTTTFRLAEASTSIDSVHPSGNQMSGINQIEQGETMVIAGRTNIEPEENTISVELLQEDSPVALVSTDQWSRDNGRWTVEIDTSEIETGTYDLESEDGQGNSDVVEVEIVTERAMEPEPEPGASPTPRVVTEVRTRTVQQPSPEPRTVVVTQTPSGQPGFGVAVALVALLAAAMLALRRRD